MSVFDGKTGQLLRSFFGINPSTFTGGVFVATGDVNRDGRADILIATGPGSPPVVTAFDSSTLQVVENFLAYDSTFTGGVYVGADGPPRRPM